MPTNMGMTTRGLVLILSLALLAAGLLLGFLPRSVEGVGCGSAFVGSDAAAVADYGATLSGGPNDGTSVYTQPTYTSRCAGARSGTRAPAVVLLAIGGVLAAGTWLLGQLDAERAT